MSNSKENRPEEHVDDMLVAYLEHSLGPEERTLVKDHLRTCEKCAQEAQSLGEMMGMLGEYGADLCPEPEKLHEYVETGTDPEGKIAAHINECALCGKEIETLKAACQLESMPSPLWERVRKRISPLPATESAQRPPGTIRQSVLERVRSLFEAPIVRWAAAAVTVAVLFIVVYPRGTPRPIMGLSTITWEEQGVLIPKTEPLAPPKPKVAIMLFFEGFEKRLPQAEVDALYRSLGPVVANLESLNVVDPSDVREVLLAARFTHERRRALLSLLAKRLKVSYSLFLTIRNLRGRYEIGAELVEISSQRTLRTEAVAPISRSDLQRKLSETVKVILGILPTQETH